MVYEVWKIRFKTKFLKDESKTKFVKDFVITNNDILVEDQLVIKN